MLNVTRFADNLPLYLPLILLGFLVNGCSDTKFANTSMGSSGSSSEDSRGQNSSSAGGNADGGADNAAGGAADGDADANLSAQDKFPISEMPPRANTDVLMLVDTSGSMVGDDDDEGEGIQEREKLQETLPGFIKSLEAAIGPEHMQLYLVATKFNINLTEPSFTIDRNVSSHNALEVAHSVLRALVRGPMANAPALRSDSNIELIIFTDDESDWTVAEFQRKIGALGISDRLKVNGAVGFVMGLDDGDRPAPGAPAWCTIKARGQRYMDLGLMTKGVIQDLCNDDWKELLGKFTGSIVAGIKPYTFVLSKAMDASKGVSVSSAGGKLPDKCLKIEQTSNSVTIVEACRGQVKSEVLIKYSPKA